MHSSRCDHTLGRNKLPKGTQLLELSHAVPYLAFSIKLGNAHFYFIHCCVDVIENSQGMQRAF